MGYRIKTISDLLGIPRNTLLAWERRYSIVKPVRQPNGYREYSDTDLNRLKAVKHFLDRGHRISEAISLSEGMSIEPLTSQDAEDPIELREAILEMLLQLDRSGADRQLRQVAGMSFSRRIDTIFTPILRETGDRWEAGTLSVAQEHYISSFCRAHLTAMLLSLEYGPENGPLVICASWSEDQHDIPLLSVAVKLALKGCRVVFLGARTPRADLIALCKQRMPSKVCLSVTIPITVPELTAAAAELASLGCGVVIGGQGLPAELPEVDGIRWARSSAEA